MLVGDVGRPGRPGPRRRPRQRLAGALPPAQVHARLAGRGRGRDHHPPRSRGLGRGQVRRHPRPAPQAGRGGPALLARPARHQQRLPGDRRGRRGRWPGTASSMARSSAGATGRSCRSSRSRPGSGARRRPTAIQAEVPVIYVAFDALALGPGGGRPVEPLLREPLTERRARLDALDLPLADRRRPVRALAPRSSPADVDALEAAFVDARARRNEGLMVKDPDSIYVPGPARSRLAEDEEGARDDRLRRRRRRGRARQAPRRPERLHVRRPRHRRPTGWSTSARRTAA